MIKSYIAHLMENKIAVLILVVILLGLGAYAAEPPAIKSVEVEFGQLSLNEKGIFFERDKLKTLYAFSSDPHASVLSIPGYQRFQFDPKFWRPGTKEGLNGIKLVGSNGTGIDTIDIQYGEKIEVIRIEILYLRAPKIVIWKLRKK